MIGVFMRGRRVRESNVLSGERLTVAHTEIIVRYPGTAKTATEAAVGRPPAHNPPQMPLPGTGELPYRHCLCPVTAYNESAGGVAAQLISTLPRTCRMTR